MARAADDHGGSEAAAAPFDLPQPISDADAARYREIFALQEDGKWREADREIAHLTDRVLLGHVMAQRYLHPTRYRSRYAELAGWLQHYADHPDAKRIYRLALKRKPRRASAPVPPRMLPGLQHAAAGDDDDGNPVGMRGLRYSHEVAAIHRRVRSMVHREWLTAAQKYVMSRAGRLGQAHVDIANARIAAGWFHWGNDVKAFALAHDSAMRSGKYAPLAHWYAGLAAYRLGRAADAAAHFEAMARLDGLSGWSRAAAAFWAARANMVARRPAEVSRWLAVAAEHPRTFYGILGRRLLGTPSPFRWDDPVLTDGDITAALGNPYARRALTLIQVGEYERAGRELRPLARSGDAAVRLALVAIADHVGLPSIALRAATALDGEDRHRVARGLYPIPRWTPDEGFTVDRALIYAVMRQESAFNARAKSYAGARGLMQLMPATAGYMANKRFRGRTRNRLYDPGLNMALGQKYLHYLIQHEGIDGDLFMAIAAYNAGPGNLARWKRKVEKRTDDALLFIESIPARETRNFIERVLANLWMYRERLGQPTPALDAIAAGRRPVYKSLDRSQLAEAPDGRN